MALLHDTICIKILCLLGGFHRYLQINVLNLFYCRNTLLYLLPKCDLFSRTIHSHKMILQFPQILLQ